MTFILDTNILSNAQTAQPDVSVRSWLLKQEQVAIPFPVFLEIGHGICEVRKSNPAKAARLSAWLAEVTASDCVYPAVTPEVAGQLAELNCCGPLKQLWYTDIQYPKAKKPGQDLFIASIALVYDMPIATLDVHDFAMIDRHYPLPGVYDPSRNVWAVERTSREKRSQGPARTQPRELSQEEYHIRHRSLSA